MQTPPGESYECTGGDVMESTVYEFSDHVVIKLKRFALISPKKQDIVSVSRLVEIKRLGSTDDVLVTHYCCDYPKHVQCNCVKQALTLYRKSHTYQSVLRAYQDVRDTDLLFLEELLDHAAGHYDNRQRVQPGDQPAYSE